VILTIQKPPTIMKHQFLLGEKTSPESKMKSTGRGYIGEACKTHLQCQCSKSGDEKGKTEPGSSAKRGRRPTCRVRFRFPVINSHRDDVRNIAIPRLGWCFGRTLVPQLHQRNQTWPHPRHKHWMPCIHKQHTDKRERTHFSRRPKPLISQDAGTGTGPTRRRTLFPKHPPPNTSSTSASQGRVTRTWL
jgi:hypothetical protein